MQRITGQACRTERIILATALIQMAAAASLFGQTTFTHDMGTCTGVAPLTTNGFFPGDLLTENAPAAPVVVISYVDLGLQTGDEINALSFGDDRAIKRRHRLVFSVDPDVRGNAGTGTRSEYTAGYSGCPAEACGDLFVQRRVGAGNRLARAGWGYQDGSYNGDQSNAAWACPNTTAAADDLDAFDYSDGAQADGVYFSLCPGSPTLLLGGYTAGDILYSDLTGALPALATLQGGGPATADELGIPGDDLDALNLFEASAGVIAQGDVGATVAGPGPASTHLIEFSSANSNGVFEPGDILVRTGFGAADVQVSPTALGLPATDRNNVNALEAVPPKFVSDPGNNPTGGSGVTTATLQADYSPAGNELLLEFMYTLDALGVTAIRIHNAPQGQTGPVVFDLGIPRTEIYRTWNVPEPLLNALYAEELYLKISTMADPQGAYRDQIRLSDFADTDQDGIADDLDVCVSAPAPGGVDEDGRPLGDTDGDCDLDLEDFGRFGANFSGPQ